MHLQAIRADTLGYFWVKGPDRIAFLQGQSTPDIRSLPEGSAVIGAFLDPKGRMLANGWFAMAKDGILVVMAAELIEGLLLHLQRFVLRAKVDFEQAKESPLWIIDEQLRDEKRAWPEERPSKVFSEEENGWIIRYPESLQIRQCAEQDLPESVKVMRGSSSSLVLTRYGIALITSATKEAFLPQMLNLERFGGISYAKGCYTGQEIVTRTHFLGRLKRSLFTVMSDVDGHWLPGVPIQDPVSGESCGTLLQGERFPSGGFIGLACLNTSSDLTRLSLDGAPISARRIENEDNKGDSL